MRPGWLLASKPWLHSGGNEQREQGPSPEPITCNSLQAGPAVRHCPERWRRQPTGRIDCRVASVCWTTLNGLQYVSKPTQSTEAGMARDEVISEGAYLGGRPRGGRMGGRGAMGCRRGPDHKAGTA